jgi:hypothetical protein
MESKEHMMNSKYKIGACCWNSRYELLGMVLLVIATLLTIIAWDSFGIVAMFVVGLVLIAHKHFCYIGCHSSCHTEGDDVDIEVVKGSYTVVDDTDAATKESGRKKKE